MGKLVWVLWQYVVPNPDNLHIARGQMSKGDRQTQPKNVKVRRSYSRNGCLQCKQRKQKCDEQKPRCSGCVANGTDCSYKKVLKFHNRRSFTVKGSRLDNVQGVTDDAKVRKSELPQLQSKSNKTCQELTNFSSAEYTVTLPMKDPSVDLFCDRLPKVVENQNKEINIESSVVPNNHTFSEQSTQFSNFPKLYYATTSQDHQNGNFPPLLTQIELENSLFDGASNLITDLNSLINSVEINFNPTKFQPQFDQYPLSNLPVNVGDTNANTLNMNSTITPTGMYTPTLADIRFLGISPTNYSIDSQSVATEDYSQDKISNNESDEDDYDSNSYIKTLTKSLSDYKTQRKDDRKKLEHSPIVNKISFNNITEDSVFGPTDVNSRKAFPNPSKDTLIPFDFIEMLKKTKSENITKYLAYFFNWSPESSHTKYLKIFVTHIHLNIIPFSTNYTHNAYMNIFLKRAKDAPHLLFAILAISARFEVYQLEQNPDIPEFEEKLEYHNSFRTYYLSSCLKALESILHTKQTTLNNVESLLLTIQMLASDFSGNKGSQWRTHLHGAKDLLVKYCRYRPLSLELTIVWLWFYSMEVLASLTSPNGGTIHDFGEMDEFLPVLCPKFPQYLKDFGKADIEFHNPQSKLLEPGRLTETLVYMGICIPGTIINDETSNFNMYLGYDEIMLEVFNMLVYGIECLRRKKKIDNKEFKNENTEDSSEATDRDNEESKDDIRLYRNKLLESEGKVFNSDYFLSICGLIKKARSFRYISNTPPYVISLSSDLHPFNILNEVLVECKDLKNPPHLEKVLSSTYIHPKQSSQIDTISDSLENNSASNLNLSDELFASIEQCKSEVYFSWIDLAQQLNVDASYLRLLTLPGGIQENGVSIKSPMIQDVVKRMIMGLYGLVRFKEEIAEDIDNIKDGRLDPLDDRYHEVVASDDQFSWSNFAFDEYLNYQFDNRLVMVQWPLYVCGLCCIEPQHKAVIECCFCGLIGLGAGSGEISLRKLQKIWTLQKLGEFDYDSYDLFGQGFDDDDDDYVPFM